MMEEAVAVVVAAEGPPLDDVKYESWWEAELQLTPDEVCEVNPWMLHKIKGTFWTEVVPGASWCDGTPSLEKELTFSCVVDKKLLQATLPVLRKSSKILRTFGPICVVSVSEGERYPYHWGTKKDIVDAATTVLGECLGKIELDSRQLVPKIEAVINRRKELWPYSREEIHHFLMLPEFSQMVEKYYGKRLKQKDGVVSANYNRMKANKATKVGRRRWYWQMLRVLAFVFYLALGLVVAYVALMVFLSDFLLNATMVCLVVIGLGLIVQDSVKWFLSFEATITPKFLSFTSLRIPMRCSHGVELPPMDEDASITGDVPCDRCETDKAVDVWGILNSGVPLVVPLGCVHDVYNGLRIRFVFQRVADTKIISRMSENFLKLFTINSVWPDISHDEWVDHLPSRRKNIMREAIGKIDHSTIKCDIFVKREAYVGKGWSFKPRIIWCRQPEFQVEVGAFFYCFGKWLGGHFGMHSEHCYDSGLTADQIGYRGVVSSKYKRLLEMDVSNWDGSLHNKWQGLEKTLVKLVPFVKHNPALFKHWGTIIGYCRQGLVVNTLHGRRSGDMWTSTLNSMINICIVVDVLGVECYLTVKGDDGFVGTNSNITVQEIVEVYASIGMKVKVFEKTLFNLGYCSGKFWLTDYGVKWGVEPWRVMSKLFLNMNRRPERERLGIMKGTCISMLPIASHVPLIGTLLNNLVTEMEGVKPIFDDADIQYKITADVVTPLSDSAIHQACLLYDLSEEQYFDIEQAIAALKMNDLPCVIIDPLMSRVAATAVEADSPPEDWYAGEKRQEQISQNPWYSVHPETFVQLMWLNLAIYGYFLFNLPLWFYPLQLLFWSTTDVPQKYLKENPRMFKLVICFLGPLHEELLRELMPYFTLIIMAAEGRQNWLAHWLISYLPWQYRVIVHVAWNSFLMTRNSGLINPLSLIFTIFNKNKKQSNTKTRKDTKKSIKPIIKQILLEGGSALGGFSASAAGLPSSLGAGLGRKAASYVSRVIGSGDYRVNSNSLITGSGPPVFSEGKRSTIISHREPLGDISGSVNFSSTRYTINPGDSITFPWLSGVAQNYSQYRIHGLIFSFESRSSDALNSTNTALGSVLMATQYNVNERAYVNKQEMENAVFSTALKPSSSGLHPIECDPKEKVLQLMYVRTPDQTGTEDPRFYDHGSFTIATVGMQAAAVIGEVWVTYEIEFFKPILIPGGYNSPLWAHQRITSYTNTEILGPIIVANDGNMDLSVSATGAGFDTVSFPATLSSGTFLFSFVWKGSSTAAVSISTTFTNCGMLNVWDNNTGDLASNFNNTSTRFIFTGVLRINGPGAKFRFSTATLPTSGVSGDLFLSQVGEGVGLLNKRNVLEEEKSSDYITIKYV